MHQKKDAPMLSAFPPIVVVVGVSVDRSMVVVVSSPPPLPSLDESIQLVICSVVDDLIL